MRIPVSLLPLLFSASISAAPVQQEVDYLVNFVAASGCAFLRNDKVHDSVSAADHLRRKYQQGKRWVGSAEQFIDRIASGSSLSGKPYRVDCDGAEMTSGEWLHQALDQHRSGMSSR